MIVALLIFSFLRLSQPLPTTKPASTSFENIFPPPHQVWTTEESIILHYFLLYDDEISSLCDELMFDDVRLLSPSRKVSVDIDKGSMSQYLDGLLEPSALSSDKDVAMVIEPMKRQLVSLAPRQVRAESIASVIKNHTPCDSLKNTYTAFLNSK
jgi:hypothetical protein